jgi:hypothetical protein
LASLRRESKMRSQGSSAATGPGRMHSDMDGSLRMTNAHIFSVFGIRNLTIMRNLDLTGLDQIAFTIRPSSQMEICVLWYDYCGRALKCSISIRARLSFCPGNGPDSYYVNTEQERIRLMLKNDGGFALGFCVLRCLPLEHRGPCSGPYLHVWDFQPPKEAVNRATYRSEETRSKGCRGDNCF